MFSYRQLTPRRRAAGLSDRRTTTGLPTAHVEFHNISDKR